MDNLETILIQMRQQQFTNSENLKKYCQQTPQNIQNEALRFGEKADLKIGGIGKLLIPGKFVAECVSQVIPKNKASELFLSNFRDLNPRSNAHSQNTWLDWLERNIPSEKQYYEVKDLMLSYRPDTKVSYLFQIIKRYSELRSIPDAIDEILDEIQQLKGTSSRKSPKKAVPHNQWARVAEGHRRTVFNFDGAVEEFIENLDRGLKDE